MERILILGILASALLTSCASLNPYERESKHMLTYYSGATFCWAPNGAENKTSSCQNEAADASLSQCVDELRPTAGFFTGSEVARRDLSLCMQRKGWQLLFIEGVILFGERHNYSFKRTAATVCANIMRYAAAAA